MEKSWSWWHPFRRRVPRGRPRSVLTVEPLEERRLLSVGNLDLGFGSLGLLSDPAAGLARINALIAPSDGNDRTPDAILAVGQAGGDFLIARYLGADGTPDSAFNGSGRVLLDFAGGEDSATAVLALGNRFLVAGFATTASGSRDLALARVSGSGTVEATFTLDLGGQETVSALALDATGNLLVGGTTSVNGGDFFVIRLVSTSLGGTFALDTSFGSGGVARIDVAGVDEASGLAVAADGSILLVGTSEGAGRDISLVRLTPAGSLDSSFGSAGKVLLDFAGGEDSGTGVTVQADGKIVVAGTANRGRFDFVALARFTTQGTLDTSFGRETIGPAGTATTALGPLSDRALDFTVQPNGRLVIAGSTTRDEVDRSVTDFILVRWTSEGLLDADFGLDGRLLSPFPAGPGLAHAVAATDNGQLLAGGLIGTGPLGTAAIARFQADTRPITQDNFGIALTGRLNEELAVAVLANDFDPDPGDAGALRVRELIVDGNRIPAGMAQTLTINLLGGGIFTGTFFTDGITVRVLPDSSNFTGNLSFRYVVSDGWLTQTGNIDLAITAGDFKAGDFDLRFGGSEGLVLDRVLLNAALNDAVLQPLTAGDRLVVGGSAFNGSNDDLVLARYLANGSLDTTFGNGGRVVLDLGAGEEIAALAVQDIGGQKKILAAGSFFTATTSDLFVARFNEDGSLDTTFGVNGFAVLDLGGLESATSLALQGGTIVAAGFRTQTGQSTDMVVARLLADGSFDTSFAGTGSRRVDINGRNDSARAVALTAGGEIVLAGFSSAGDATGNDFALVRLDAAGNLDTTFDSDGVVLTDFAGNNDLINAIAIDGLGRYVVGGFATSAVGDRDFAAARYLSSGVLDTSFDSDGQATFDLGASTDEARALILDGSDLLLGGVARIVNGSFVSNRNQDFAAVRLNSSGALVTTFGTGGRLTIDFTGGDDAAQTLVLSGSTLLLAGRATDNQGAGGLGLAAVDRDTGVAVAGFGGLVPGVGNAALTIGLSNAQANAVAVLPDGSFFLAGSGVGGSQTMDFALARFLADGSLDRTFAFAGINGRNFGFGDDAATGILVTATHIWLTGWATNASGDEDFALARFNRGTGAFEAQFLFDLSSGGHDRALAAVQAADGTFLLGGFATSTATGRDFALLRFDPATGNLLGSLVTPAAGDQAANALALFTESGVEKVVLAGGTGLGSDRDMAFAVHRADTLALERNFVSGIAGREDEARAVTVAGGTIYAGGSVVNVLTGRDLLAARFDLAGNPDTAFGSAGFVEFSTSSLDDTVQGLFLDGSQVVLAGTSTQTDRSFGVVVRLNDDGSPDVTFGVQGRVFNSSGVGGGDMQVLAATRSPSGEYLLAGSTEDTPTSFSRFLATRLRSVNSANFIPLARPDFAAVATGENVTVFVLNNDVDQNADTLTVDPVLALAPSNGVAVVNADGTITYTPNLGFTGTDFFDYRVRDGVGGQSVARVTVQVFAPDPGLASALGVGGGLVTAVRYISASSPTAAGTYPFPLSGFTGTVALLTSGDVSVASSNTSAGVDNRVLLGGARQGAFDPIILEITVNVPLGANFLAFDYLFASNEYPLQLGLGTNDTFLAELDRSTWTIGPDGVDAPDDFAFPIQTAGNVPISIDTVYFSGRRVTTLTDTLYNGSTPKLTAGVPVTPGLHTIYLSLFDVGDGQIDSAVFVNNVRALTLTPENLMPGSTQGPLALDDWAAAPAGQPVVIDLLDDDLIYDNQPVRVLSVGPASNGSVVLNADGRSVTYTPNPGFVGTDSFEYTLVDGRGATSTANVTVLSVILTRDASSAAPTDLTVQAQVPIALAQLNNQTPGSPASGLTVAQYLANPTGVPNGTGIFFDVLAPLTNSSDTVMVIASDPSGQGVLMYFDGAVWRPVRGVGDTAPVRLADGRLMVLLGRDSAPRVTGLFGTVFMAPVDAPPPPPVTTSSPTAGTGSGSVTANLDSSVQASISLSSSQTTAVTASDTTLASRQGLSGGGPSAAGQPSSGGTASGSTDDGLAFVARAMSLMVTQPNVTMALLRQRFPLPAPEVTSATAVSQAPPEEEGLWWPAALVLGSALCLPLTSFGQHRRSASGDRARPVPH